jgi:pseudooxynicotine oxidase
MFDVIIIGAGLGGLRAAQSCKSAGLKSLVLEASLRVGGRVWTDAAPATKLSVDWGAEWIIPSMHHEVMNLVKEHKLDLLEDSSSTPTAWQTRHTTYIGSYSELQKQNAAFAMSLKRIEQDAMLWLNAKPVTTQPETSAQTYLRHVAPDIETAELLEAALFPLTGADPEHLATHMLWAEIGFHNQSIDDTLNAPATRIAQGCSALAIALLKTLDGNIEYDQIVTHISQLENGYIIQTKKSIYQAKHCIVAVPLMTLSQIEMSPPLAQDSQDVANNSNAGRVAKAWALIRSKKPLGETLNSHSQLRYGYTRRVDAEHTLVCGQILSDGKNAITADDACNLIKANWPGVELIEAAVVDWTHEPFAKASWHSGRAGWAGKTSVFRAPRGNLHFAGGDFAAEWAGWMEGALLSGKAVGQRVVASSQS